MQYIVIVKLPDEMSHEFMALIPSHRARINKLIPRGILLSYSLNMERTHIWMIFNVKEAEEVERILHSLPLHAHFISYDIQMLMFHNASSGVLPSISLN